MSFNQANEANRPYTWGEITELNADRLIESGRYVDLLQITCDPSESEDMAPASEIDGNLGEAYEKAARNFKITEAYLGIVCNDDTDTILFATMTELRTDTK